MMYEPGPIFSGPVSVQPISPETISNIILRMVEIPLHTVASQQPTPIMTAATFLA